MLKGNLSSLRELKANLRALPVSIAHSVAQRAAPVLTALTVQAFDGDQNVYGDARPPSKVDGRALTLERTGATRRTLRFVANGTIMRCVLGTRYARYLIGKYGILPNGALPARWSQRLGQLVAEMKPGLP